MMPPGHRTLRDKSDTYKFNDINNKSDRSYNL